MLKDLLTGSSWLTLLIGVLVAIDSFVRLSALGADLTPAPAGWGDHRQTVVAFVLFVAATAVGIALLVWIYQANSVCHRSGAKAMRFTPGWSVGWVFIPLANLWMPLQVVKEIWQVSKNPANWPDEAVPALPGWWWACQLLSFAFIKWNFLMLMLALIFDIDFLNPGDDPVYTSLLLSLVSAAMLIAMCATTIVLVNGVSSNQAKFPGQ